jgi:hypothetical protein
MGGFGLTWFVRAGLGGFRVGVNWGICDGRRGRGGVCVGRSCCDVRDRPELLDPGKRTVPPCLTNEAASLDFGRADPRSLSLLWGGNSSTVQLGFEEQLGALPVLCYSHPIIYKSTHKTYNKNFSIEVITSEERLEVERTI